MLILKDLQLDETSDEHGAQQHDAHGGDNHPTKKHALLAPRVLQRQGAGHGSDPSGNILADVLQ